jgi:CHAT domain-containing protein/tetratricopeptide (TPR) repeat protein
VRRCLLPAAVLVLAAVTVAAAGCGDHPPAGERADADRVAGVDSLLAPGMEEYWSADYGAAKRIWSDALNAALAEGDSVAMAHLETWLGLTAMRSGDFEGARSHGEAALELKLALADHPDLARSYNALGLLAEAEVRLLDALRLYERARETALAAGDRRTVAAATGNSGLIHAYLGDLDRATVLLGEMRETAVELGDARLEGNALTNLAMVAVWAGDPHSALEPLAEARKRYREVGYPLGEQVAVGQLATALEAMGRYQEALVAVDHALSLSREHGLRGQETENLGILSGLFAGLGDTRRALRHLEEATDLARDSGLEWELGVLLRQSASLHLSLGSHDRAVADALAALTAHRSAGETFEELDDLLVLAAIHQRAGDGDRAETALRSARLIAGELDTRSALSAVALAEARHAAASGDPRQVLAALDRARAASLDVDSRTRMELHGLAARAYATLGQLDSAAVAGLASVRALERVRGGLASGDLRASFVSASAQVYSDAVLILLQLDRADEAFAVADAARSRELLQRLTAVRPPPGDGDEPGIITDPAVAGLGLRAAERLLTRIDALLAQLRELDTVLPLDRGAGAEATAGDITARISRLRDEYESVLVRTARLDRRSAAMLGGVRTDQAHVRAALGGDEAVLHYTLTPDALIVFVARADRIESLEVPVRPEDLASRIRLLRELWGSRDGVAEHGLPAAQGLHDLLIAPLARAGLMDGAERLIIVPHGVLEQLPFAALHDRSTGRFLVEDHVIAYAPSAGAIPALREARGAASLDVAAVQSFAPFPVQLPGTRAEADMVRGAGRDGRVHLGPRATEAQLRRALAGNGVVHVASHGTLNARNPMFSRIELARGSGASADDGRLEVHEVLGLQVNSPLVVLSGCETALAEDWTGNALRPAGIATLAQAFLQAGAGAVIATLWRIDDQGSAELVSRFYRLAAAGTVADALAGAQREMIQDPDPRYASPYYWAGFVLSGEGPPFAAPQSVVTASVP